MLTAILHGKAGRVELDGLPVSWRQLFRKREDLLTAVFFGRLPYLSDEAQEQILALLIGKTLAGEFGQLRDIRFWPKLDGTEGRKYVEPDVVLEFNEHLLLVEVKPPFGGSQSSQQWRNEIQSLQSNNDDEKNIVLLALGRNMPGWRTMAQKLEVEFEELNLRIFCREWHDLLSAISSMRNEAETRDARIYADWFEAFHLFGMITAIAPFSDLLPLCSSAEIFNESFAALQRWAPKAQNQHKTITYIDWTSLLPLVRELEQEEFQWT